MPTLRLAAGARRRRRAVAGHVHERLPQRLLVLAAARLLAPVNRVAAVAAVEVGGQVVLLAGGELLEAQPGNVSVGADVQGGPVGFEAALGLDFEDGAAAEKVGEAGARAGDEPAGNLHGLQGLTLADGGR
jgi:hypothetical protein